MNVQERALLTGFLQQLAQAQAGPKDTEATALIGDTLARQPDAVYLLVQRALILDGALNNAQARVAELQGQIEQQKAQSASLVSPAQSANFLDANAWGRASSPPAAAAVMQNTGIRPQSGGLSGVTTTGNYGAPQAAALGASPTAGFQAPSFLTSIATTAAGVAAGAFLFQGVNHMFGSHGDNSLPGSAAHLPPPSATDNTVINNYYSQPEPADPANSVEASDFTSVADASDLSDGGEGGSYESA